MSTCYDIFIMRNPPPDPHFDYFFDERGKLTSMRCKQDMEPPKPESVDPVWSKYVVNLINNELLGVFNRLKIDKSMISHIPCGNAWLLFSLLQSKMIDRKAFRVSLENMVRNFVPVKESDPEEWKEE